MIFRNKKGQFIEGHTINKGRIPWNKGISHTKETKQKIKEKRKYQVFSKETREKISKSHIGKKHSFETRIKIRNGKLGSKNSAWRGGVAKQKYPNVFNRLLREQIKKRDNYSCQECNINQKEVGKALEVHHIDYNKNNNSKNNLITLCGVCHRRTYYDINKWINYYQKVMEEHKNGMESNRTRYMET